MTTVRWKTYWIWRETFDYTFDSPLPDDWDDMTNFDKAQFLEQFDCESIDKEPICPDGHNYEDDEFEVLD